MDVDPSQIIIGAGTEYVTFIVVSLFGRNAVYCVENPGYRKIASVFQMNGARCVPVNVDDEGIDVRAVRESGASVVHVSPSHHFPRGTVMSLNRRLELLSWAAADENHFIIEDDYDSEFRFTGRPLETLFGAASKSVIACGKGAGHVIYTNTFSKTLSPSFRISYMVLPPPLAEKFRKNANFLTCPVSVFEQSALSRFMQNGSYEKHIIRMKNSHISSIREQNAGLHFLLEFNAPVSGMRLQHSFLENGLDIPLLSEYWTGDGLNELDKPVFVMNYSGISREVIPEAVARMNSAIKTLL